MLNEQEYTYYRSRLAIDRNYLDDALINLPMDQMEVAEYTAAASAARDQAETAYDNVVATVSDYMRRDVPAGGKEPSEASIKAQLPLFDEIKTAKDDMITADYEYSLWKALADAMRTKGTSIRVIADLVAAGYITTDTLYQQNREAMHQQRVQRQTG